MGNKTTPDPIFIVGSGRCGNTLLRAKLVNHNRIYSPPETYVLGQIIRDFNIIKNIGWPLVVSHTLFQFSTSEDFVYFPTPYLRDLKLNLLKVPQNEQTLAKVIDEFYRYMAAQIKPHADIWLDKTPMNAFICNELSSIFPQARFIHIIRNVYDASHSYIKMGRYASYEEAAKRWVAANTAIETAKKANSEKFLVIKYEDLVTHPYSKMKEICDFLNVNYDSELVDNTPDPKVLGDADVSHYNNINNTISSSGVGRALRAIPQDKIEAIDDIAAPLMRQYDFTAHV